jgi:hypothetical protein
VKQQWFKEGYKAGVMHPTLQTGHLPDDEKISDPRKHEHVGCKN